MATTTTNLAAGLAHDPVRAIVRRTATGRPPPDHHRPPTRRNQDPDPSLAPDHDLDPDPDPHRPINEPLHDVDLSIRVCGGEEKKGNVPVVELNFSQPVLKFCHALSVSAVLNKVDKE